MAINHPHRMTRCWRPLCLAAALFTLSPAQAEDAPAQAEEAEAGTHTITWAGCGITKKAFMAELAKAYEKKTGIKVELQGGGATKGIREASKGTITIGGACRVSLERHPMEKDADQVPVAWDALVVIVHKDNPVDNITFEQMRDLYLGKIKNWKELGGNDAPVELYIRQGNLSGVGRTLRELVFAEMDQKFVAKHEVKSTGPLEKGIEANPLGIGTTGISSAKRRDVKILKLEGIEPTYDAIKNGDYTLYRPLYLVRQKGKHDPDADAFIRFAQSTEGKQIIRDAGTVPYSDALALIMQQLDQYRRANQYRREQRGN